MTAITATPPKTEPKAYIPESGIRFRLVNVQSQQVLFDNPDGRFGVLRGAEYPDQWWTLAKDFGAHPGGYKIKNVKSGRFLFANDKREIGAFGGDYDDQYFTLVPGRAEYAQRFQIKCYRNDLCIFANSSGRRGASVRDSDSADQYWMIEYEEMEFVKIEYGTDKVDLYGQAPKLILSFNFPNASSVPQVHSFESNESIEQSSHFEWEWGAQLKVGYAFTCSVPTAGEITGSVEASGSLGHKWGEERTDKRSYKITFPITCPPGKEIRATASVTQATMCVPFVMKLRSKVSGIETECGGLWKGVTSWGLVQNIEEFPLAKRD